MYDVEGYPVLEKNHGIHVYSLEFYERQSIDEIKRGLEKGLSHEVALQCKDYLNSLLKKLLRIASVEESEGVFNSELRKNIDEIKSLLRQIDARAYAAG